jgi:serine/threonine protein kinase
MARGFRNIQLKSGDVVVGRYEILAPVGGSMEWYSGYRALDNHRKLTVHLDVIPKRDDRWVVALRREYSALRELDHPSIIKAYDFYEDDHFAVSERVLKLLD